MQNGQRTNRTRHSRPARSQAARPKGWTSRGTRPEGAQNAQRNYEKYVTLARALALSGDVIGAENYYQHAEHYYRAMAGAGEAPPETPEGRT